MFGRVEFPTSFTGVRRVEGIAEVYRVPRPGRDLDKAVATEFPGVRVAFCDVPRSEPQLRALDQEIHDDLAWQKKQDITIAWATLDARRGMVKVAVENPDEVRSRIVERYGGGVFVVRGEAVPVEAASLT